MISLRSLLATGLGLTAAAILGSGCNSDDDNTTNDNSTGYIYGTVLDADDGSRVAGATVKCGGQSSTSGSDGNYEITDIPVGNQTVIASKAGYQMYSRSIVVPTDDPVDIYLTPAPGSENNIVRLDCPVSVPTPTVDTEIRIDVYITNDVNISAFSLGFSYNSDDVEIIDLEAGSALPDEASMYGMPQPDDNMFLAGWVEFDPNAVLPPSTDVWAFSLVMSVPAGTAAQSISLEPAFVPPAGDFIFAPSAGGQVTPSFEDCGEADVVIGGPAGAAKD